MAPVRDLIERLDVSGILHHVAQSTEPCGDDLKRPWEESDNGAGLLWLAAALDVDHHRLVAATGALLEEVVEQVETRSPETIQVLEAVHAWQRGETSAEDVSRWGNDALALVESEDPGQISLTEPWMDEVSAAVYWLSELVSAEAIALDECADHLAHAVELKIGWGNRPDDWPQKSKLASDEARRRFAATIRAQIPFAHLQAAARRSGLWLLSSRCVERNAQPGRAERCEGPDRLPLQSEKDGQALRKPEEGEGKSPSLICSSIARQPLVPCQAGMCTLCPRDQGSRRSRGSLQDWLHLNLQILAMHTQTGVSLVPSGPISPEQRSRTDRERMEKDAHVTRFGGGTASPLALFAQRTWTAGTDTGTIHHTQAPIGFSAVFMRQERAPSRAAQRPIRLEGEICAGKATSFPGHRGGRRSLSRSGRRGRRRGFVLRWKSRRTFCRAHWFRCERVPHLQAQVPGPLADDVPGLLTWCRLAHPAVRLLFQVFIGQRMFKRAAMQGEGHDIDSRKRALGTRRHEPFGDHT